MSLQPASSLRTHLLLVALLPVALVALGITTLLLNHHFADLTDAFERRGVALARQTAAGSEFAIFSGNRELLVALAQGLMQTDSDVVGVAIKDAAGATLAQTGDLSLANDADPWSDQAIRRDARETVITVPVERLVLNVDDFYSEAHAKVSAKASGASGVVVVVLSHQKLAEQHKQLIWAAAVMALLGIGLGGGLALVLARGISRPLLQATDVVTRIGNGELASRMSHASAGPLNSLAIGINAMASRLDAMQDDLRAQVAEATAGLRQQKEAAEAATVAKSRFLAAASHDLRQPLHALGLFVSHLSQSALRNEHADVVARIEESVASLQSLLENLLDLSRLDLKKRAPTWKSFDVNKLLRKVCRGLVPIAESKQLDLRLRESRHRVRSDPRLLERLMSNLIANALRYTEHGTVLVACRRRGDKLRMEVWDTGVGIPPERQKDIFEEYVQIGNEERDRSKGLGLGLAICRHIATAMGTTIGLRSVPGRGSVFWIDLPLSEAGIPLKPDTEARRIQLPPSPPVLVVSEDSDSLEAITEVIVAWGGTALHAADRDAALRLCREQEPPPMAICDVYLAGSQGGIAVGEELRREFPTMSILLIGPGDASEIKAAARCAGFTLLGKPVPPGRIRAALQQMGAGESESSANSRQDSGAGRVPA